MSITRVSENTFCIDDASGELFAKNLLRDDARRIAREQAQRTRTMFVVYNAVEPLDFEAVPPLHTGDATSGFSSSWPPDGAYVVARVQTGAHVSTRMAVEFKGYLNDCDGEEIKDRYLGYRFMTERELADWITAINLEATAE